MINQNLSSNPSASSSILIFFIALQALLFTTPANAQNKGTLTDTRDGRVYQTITIGEQTWMAENLAYLPAVDYVGTGLFEQECHYVYGYNGINPDEARANTNYSEFGALYNWIAAKSACPAGWHLPTDGEWMKLEKYLGMADNELQSREWRITGETAQKIKSASGWKRGNGTNESGFNVLPAGCRGYAGFESKGYCAYFWTASTIDGDNGWRRGICSDSNGISRQEDRRYFGCSVRCVKD
jgi:uncharacterized protein (TIGR02145 family)